MNKSMREKRNHERWWEVSLRYVYVYSIHCCSSSIYTYKFSGDNFQTCNNNNNNKEGNGKYFFFVFIRRTQIIIFMKRLYGMSHRRCLYIKLIDRLLQNMTRREVTKVFVSTHWRERKKESIYWITIMINILIITMMMISVSYQFEMSLTIRPV